MLKARDYNVGEDILISPELTASDNWQRGKVIEVEQNPFVGIVITAETPKGVMYFGRDYMFKHQEIA